MLKAIPALGALVLSAALLVPTVSHAAPAISAAVSYADLDLNSVTAQKSLQRRIASAAGKMCEYRQIQDIARMSVAAACRDGAIADAKPSFDAAVAAARQGKVTVLGSASLIVRTR